MKITPLPSVEKEAEYIAMGMIHNETGHYEPVYQAELKRLTQDRDLAYTSLIEGIDGSEVVAISTVGEYEFKLDVIEFPDGFKRHKPDGYEEGYNQALADIIEKVVKPLYGKE